MRVLVAVGADSSRRRLDGGDQRAEVPASPVPERIPEEAT
jgi:hypothetical protein